MRLPLDLARRIEAKSARTGIPQNRLIVDELRAFAALKPLRDLDVVVEEMRDTLARMPPAPGPRIFRMIS
jgi:hypothetical protein